MTQLPDDANATTSYMSNSDRTEAEMKVALEQLHEVIAEIGSKGPQTLTISGGGLAAAPLSSIVYVRSEGHSSGADDVLTSMATSGITTGRMVILRNSDPSSTEAESSEKITITSGSLADNLELTEGSGSFILCARRAICFAYSGNRWIEQWRSYGRMNDEDEASERTSLGLGTAAVEAIATVVSDSASKVLKVGGSHLIADDVLKVDSSGEIVAATSVELGGGDAATLDGNLPSAFVRTNDASAQSIISNLIVTTGGATRVVADANVGGYTSGFSMEDDGVERGVLFLDTESAEVELRTATAAGTPTDSIKIDPGGGLLYNVAPSPAGGVWQTLVSGAPVADHGLPGLDADKLDGVHLVELTDDIEAGKNLAGINTWEFPSDIGHITSGEGSTSTHVDIYRTELPVSVQAYAEKKVNITVEFFDMLSSGILRANEYKFYFGANLHDTSTIPSEYDLKFEGVSTGEVPGSPRARYSGTTDYYDIEYATEDSSLFLYGGLYYRHTRLVLENFTLPPGFDSYLITACTAYGRSGGQNTFLHRTSIPSSQSGYLTAWPDKRTLIAGLRFEVFNILT